MALADRTDDVMVKKILGEINMNEKSLEEAVITMKQWLTKQPHLPPAASDDLLLKAFIIGCKSVERAKTKLDNYFTYRVTYAHLLFSNRDTAEIKWKHVTEKMMVLPGMTPDGYKVCLVTLPDSNEVADYEINETIKVFLMILDSYYREYYMSSGFLLILDFSNLSVEFSLKMSISTTSALMKIMETSYPQRMKGVIAFSAPPLADTFFNTFLVPFFSEKLKKRLHIHAEDHKIVENYCPLEMLPSDYKGGKGPSVESLWSNIRKRLESERDWFLNEGSQTVNESLRQREDFDQMRGTFRKLQVE